MQGCFQLYMTFAVNHDRDSELLLKRKLNYLGTEALFQTEESEFATTAYHEACLPGRMPLFSSTSPSIQ